jgi:hypothetical protein
MDYTLGLGLIEHSTKEDFFGMKTTQNQKFILKNNMDHTLGLGIIEHSTKEDFFGMKTTQNQIFFKNWIIL